MFEKIIQALRDNIPALNYPGSTFRIISDDCPEGSIKIMGMQSNLGPDTDYLNCDEVVMLISAAGEIGGGAA
tara:strand:- start:887 stop:1102 length:216 start_codon:yes stop_codon:yes gene_type:complete